MKLKTLEQFDDAVDREVAWRKKELLDMKFLARSARQHQQPLLLRAGIALLYAHWEGQIRALAELYIEYVKQKRLRYSELCAGILGVCFRGRLNVAVQADVGGPYAEFAEFIQNQIDHRAHFPSAAIRTKSNLNSRILKDIAFCLGISYDKYELRENLIDYRLLKARNEIAHGEWSVVGLNDFLDLHRQVVELLDDFEQDVRAGAGAESFRRSKSPVPR